MRGLILVIALAAAIVSDSSPEPLDHNCLRAGFLDDDDEALHLIQSRAKVVSQVEPEHRAQLPLALPVGDHRNRDATMVEASSWTVAGTCVGSFCNGNCTSSQNPTSDGGCCNGGWIGTGHKSCVAISSTNILKYNCGLSLVASAGNVTCRNKNSMFSNKAKLEQCSLGGETCLYTRFGWLTRTLNLGSENKQDKLQCTCKGTPVYRRTVGEAAWAPEPTTTSNSLPTINESQPQSLVVRDEDVKVSALELVANRSNDTETWGWKPQGSGCHSLLCNGNCPITMNPTSDNGCCMVGSIGTGHNTCVRITSENILKYSCGLSGIPSCKSERSFFSFKDEERVCEVDGQSCTYTRWGWFARHINLFGGNKQDRLECTCGDAFQYRRAEDGPWVSVR